MGPGGLNGRGLHWRNIGGLSELADACEHSGGSFWSALFGDVPLPCRTHIKASTFTIATLTPLTTYSDVVATCVLMLQSTM